VVAASVLAFVASLGLAYLDGQCPAPMGPPPFASTFELAEALQAVDARGTVDLAKLSAHRQALESYLSSLASTQTDTLTLPNEATAFWLNAYHALTLQTLLEHDDGWWRSWPIAGHRLTRWALVRHHLTQTGDPRVIVATCDGSKGAPRLDGAPFDSAMLENQLTDAARRFIRRAEVVHLAGTTVEVSPVLLEHEAELLAALPEGNRHLLQFVWAFLPETCDGERPGCETRAAIDSACGRKLDGCHVTRGSRDESPAVR
jgi:hypothetical protein